MPSQNPPAQIHQHPPTFSCTLNGADAMCDPSTIQGMCAECCCCFEPCPDNAHCDNAACTDEDVGNCNDVNCDISSCDDTHCDLACDVTPCGLEPPALSPGRASSCLTCFRTIWPGSESRATSSMSTTSDSSATPSPVSTPLPRQQQGDGIYCHWGDDCTFVFTSPSDLDEHLRTSHTSFLQHQDEQQQQQQQQHHLQLVQAQANSASTGLACRWDSCTVTAEELDTLLNHVKNDHMGGLTAEIPAISTDTTAAPVIVNPDGALECHWNHCSDATIDPNVVDARLLQRMSTFAAPLHCEWDACDFMTLTSSSLVSHVVHDHVPAQQQQQQYQQRQQVSHENLPSYAHHHTGHHTHGSLQIPHSHAETTRESGHHHKCLWVTDGKLCGLCFSTSQDLSEHITTSHVGSRKQEYTCMWSGCERNARAFQQRQKIIRHLQVHTHNRPFECHICGRKFAEQLVLRQHLRVHSGERPYECKVCGKRFAASTALSVHLRTHTGEKPLSCKWPGCGKTFSESSNLAKHMRTHTADRRFKCAVEGCRKDFLRHDQLVRHMRTHADVSSSDRGGSEGPNAYTKVPVKAEFAGIHDGLKLEDCKMSAIDVIYSDTLL
ncbi:hypothetical protein V1506DRAFT_532343 [Lipomyces tetrasporus]